MRMWHFGAGAALAAAAGAAGAGLVQPGLWQTTSTVSDVNMPGAPPGIAAMMRGHPTTITHCVTPEEAAKDPRALVQARKECTFSNFSMAGGKLDATMTCQDHGSTMTVTTSGTYTPTSYTATSHMVRSGEGGMTMTANVASKLLGPCTQ